MERLFYLITFSLLSLSAIGQSVSRSAITNGGKSAQTGNTRIDFSLGQAVIQTLQGSEYDLTQGFIQPPLAQANSIRPVHTTTEYTLFPNPNRGKFTLEFEDNKNELQHFIVYDNLGRVLKTGSIDGGNNTLVAFDFKSFKSGLFNLLIYNEKNQLLINEQFIIQQ